jgi:hypothetical protein
VGISYKSHKIPRNYKATPTTRHKKDARNKERKKKTTLSCPPKIIHIVKFGLSAVIICTFTG